MSLFSELKRRNVIRVTAGYVVLSWLLLQVADLLMDMLGLPDIWGKAVFGLLVIGIVPVMIFAWVYEMTPEGLKRESEISPDASITDRTGNKLNIAIIALLVVAIGVYSVDNFVLGSRSQPTVTNVESTAAKAPEETALPVIAVLPLQALSAENDARDAVRVPAWARPLGTAKRAKKLGIPVTSASSASKAGRCPSTDAFRSAASSIRSPRRSGRST